jgi:hypothetical protein
LKELDCRVAAPEASRALKAVKSGDSLASFIEIMNPALPGKSFEELPILDTRERAYACPMTSKDVVPTWRAARSLVEKTGRWPIIVIGAENDLFSRFYFEEAPDTDDVSPRALIAAAGKVDVDAFMKRKRREMDEASPPDMEDLLSFHLDATRQYFDDAPTEADVASARVDGKPITSELQLERWLLDWELARGPNKQLSQLHEPWYEPDEEMTLVFLPVNQPWDALAYINMYGTSDYGSENYIALARRWQEKYGAELVCHYGTMLQCLLTRPPATIQEAFEVAQQQYLFAPCTLQLSGTTLRHHAAGLVGYDRWFLHERP